jgi:ferredoxin
MKQAIYFSLEKCVGCGNCVDICPDAAITLIEHKAIWVKNLFDPCILCETCLDSCPEDAISTEYSWGSKIESLGWIEISKINSVEYFYLREVNKVD